MSSAEPPVGPVPPPLPPDPPRTFGGRTFFGWIATSNPLYVVSAGLFLFGLRVSFDPHDPVTGSWLLMAGLGGYTLLLAAAALLLVRFAGVWNDVRTVLLLVVLMFLATSVTFDDLLVADPARGALVNALGLGFAVAVTEVVLRAIRLRLPAGFRLPYYLALALFFLYPILLTPYLHDPRGEPLQWLLWGFSPAAGLFFLTLLPAVRRGRGYVRGNGSPWPWPFYPWSLFVFLGLAVPARAFLLCWSFHLLDGGDADRLVFGPYFVVPFGLAVAVLLLELGLERDRPTVRWAALAVPAGLVVLAGVGHSADPVYVGFLGRFMARLGGTPLCLAVLAAGAFYLYAWGRGVALAADGLAAAVLALAVVGPDTLGWDELTEPRFVPLAAVAAFQIALGVRRREVWRVLAGGVVPAGWAGIAGWRGYVALRAKVPGLDYLVAGLVLLPVALLVSLAKAGVLGRWADRRLDEPAG
ncbi:MAG: hypothetical protein K2X87_17125 [Gemmataceae bacterium]|nr:hypothetical protein [Gemmataceae bacterium]